MRIQNADWFNSGNCESDSANPHVLNYDPDRIVVVLWDSPHLYIAVRVSVRDGFVTYSVLYRRGEEDPWEPVLVRDHIGKLVELM